jgi:hypothetical protein
MSNGSSSGRTMRERLAIAAFVGVLAFVIVNISTNGDQGIGAAVVVAFVTWLLTGDQKKSEEKK